MSGDRPISDFQPTADLGAGPAPASASELTAPIAESAGSRIGAFKLLDLIGEGGFGSVFLAQQERPVQRQVALKIIKLGMDTRNVVARFEQERQALALMDHPNIARVYDAGATETGRPYFVMELVRGEPIVEFCDKRQATIRERLELFGQVCGAVQHAHTKGIIHRDIKPSNVLVSTQEDRPQVKVIDFGIAKATGPVLTDRTLFTERRQLIGTPEYMSPEQAEGSLDIDTRTDVYSLGVLLYELLTGTTPFSGSELRSATHADLQRIIREVDPPVPSTRLSRSGGDLASIAARRRIEPGKLGPMVRGDLDWIVMKAIEKDRLRRYETANGLGMDVARYLRGEAVLAAPPSTSYRLRKFVRRNRVPAIAGALVAGALVLGVVGTSVGLLEATRQRRAAEASAARAGEEALRATAAENTARLRLAEAEATVSFLDEMLGAVDPAAQGRDVTVRAVLDNAAAGVGSRFADRPLVAARLHGTIGRTYMNLGVYDDGEPHLREQLRIRTTTLGPDHEDTCRAVNDLSAFLIKQGKFDDAERTLKTALTHHETIFGRRHPLTVQTMDTLASLYNEQLRGVDAEPLLREVLEIRSATIGRAAPETTRSMATLATTLADSGRFEESGALFEESLRNQTAAGAADTLQTVEIRSNYAWMLYWYASQYDGPDPKATGELIARARVMGEDVLDAKKRLLGPEHQSTLATMNNLASVYLRLGMHDQAEALRREDLEITMRVLGDEHPDTAVSLANLGALLRARGRFGEALPFLERAIRITRKVQPPDFEGTGFALGWYAGCLVRLGRFAEAEPAFLEGRAIVAGKLGADNPITIQITRDVVTLYETWDAAEPGQGHAESAARWKKTIEAITTPEQGGTSAADSDPVR